MTPPTYSPADLLRRLVFTEPDGFSQAILKVLRALGYGSGAWARVSGDTLTVFVGGDGKGDPPELGARLVANIGGAIQSEWSPGDSYYVWCWKAEL